MFPSNRRLLSLALATAVLFPLGAFPTTLGSEPPPVTPAVSGGCVPFHLPPPPFGDVNAFFDYGDAGDNTDLPSMTTTYSGGGSGIARFPTLEHTANTVHPKQPGVRHNMVDFAWLGDISAYAATDAFGTPVVPILPTDLPPSREESAWKGFDTDLVHNLDGAWPDRDGRDNGVYPTTLATNTLGWLTVRVSTRIDLHEWYLNVLVDWNYDGEWKGHDPLNGAPEWAVENRVVNLLALTSARVLTPPFLTGTMPGTPWIRVTLSERPVDPGHYGAMGWDGSLPPFTKGAFGHDAFACGETEDHCGVLTLDGPGPAITCNTDDDPYACGKQPSFAHIADFHAGYASIWVFSAYTTIPAGLNLNTVAVTAAGGFDINVDHNCAGAVEIEVVKLTGSPTSSPPGTVHKTAVPTGCVSGRHTEHVAPVDYGEYEIIARWVGCDGGSGSHTVGFYAVP